jgi:cell division protein FtsQ
VSRAQIEAVVRRDLRGNFFTLDLAQARKSFEAIAWVRKADVRRQWPDRLDVTLEEHVPLARWGTLGLVNTQGEVFQAQYEGQLPVFNGPNGAAKEMAIQYAYFRRALEAIGREPVQVNVSARRAWSIRLDGGTTLELGRADIEGRLARYVQNHAQAASLLGRRMEYVDLRYANGFAVRIPELARAEAKERRK